MPDVHFSIYACMCEYVKGDNTWSMIHGSRLDEKLQHTFTATDDKITINAPEATSDNVSALLLPGELANKPPKVEVPHMNLLAHDDADQGINRNITITNTYIGRVIDQSILAILRNLDASKIAFH